MTVQLTVVIDIVLGQCRVELRRVASDGTWRSEVDWYTRDDWEDELTDEEFLVEGLLEKVNPVESRRVARGDQPF